MKLSNTLVLFLGTLVLLLSTTSCSINRKVLPVETVVAANNEKMLWDALRIAIYDSDFKVGGGANPAEREITSAWKLDLQPYKSQGNRKRVIASYEPINVRRDDDLESFDVSIRVETDINDSFRSLDIQYAKWKASADDEAGARRILALLIANLGTGDIDVTERGREGDASAELGFEFDRQ
ncbi:MAG: hypothetical protein AAF957_04610 [Planctomycetota bacterium]